MDTKGKKPTTALHDKSSDGSLHKVEIKNLRVVISNHEGIWFAQGMEIDYAAQGSTLEAVKKAFETGLALTIDQHLKIFGTFDKLLKPAHEDGWKEFYQAKSCAEYSQISFHKIGFGQIEYFKAAA